MRSWIFWSAITSTRTRVTAVTAIAVTLRGSSRIDG